MTRLQAFGHTLSAAVAVGLFAAAVPAQAQDANGVFVTSVYIAVLNRNPDPGGWIYWQGLLDANTLTQDQVTSSFLTGPEYTGRCAANNTSFLNCLYQDALNRAPDQGGFNYWLGLLNSGYTQSWVVEQFIAGQEFQNTQHNRLGYRTAYVTVGAYPPGVTPMNGSGPQNVPQSFTIPYRNPYGASDIQSGFVLFGTDPNNFTQAGSCYIAWIGTQSVFLWDPSNGNLQSGSFGQSGTLSNNYCSVDLAASNVGTVQGSNGGYDVNLRITFNSQFANGTHYIWLLALSMENLETGLSQVGTWTQTNTARPPTPTLIDTSNSAISPNFVAGDSYTLTISAGASFANRAITLSATLNGVSQGTTTIGTTDNNGNFTLTGTKNTVGNWTEQWYIGGVAAASTLNYYVITAPAGYDANSSFPSIPGSFTAPAPTLSCDNISGTWNVADQYGNSVQWNLQQAGNAVSGTLSFGVYRIFSGVTYSCGTITYDATGTQTGNSFSLSATNPSPQTDECGYPVPSSYTDTVTLSGSSCSTGSGVYDSTPPSDTFTPPNTMAPPGATNPQFQAAPQSRGPDTWTTLTPRFSVQYASYIPVDHVPGPTACFYGNGQFYVIKTYKGDAFRSTYRTTQSIFVIPDKQMNDNFYPETGPTRNYGFGSPANGSTLSSTPLGDIYNGTYVGADEDNAPEDCYLWNKSGHGFIGDMQGHSFFPDKSGASESVWI